MPSFSLFGLMSNTSRYICCNVNVGSLFWISSLSSTPNTPMSDPGFVSSFTLNWYDPKEEREILLILTMHTGLPLQFHKFTSFKIPLPVLKVAMLSLMSVMLMVTMVVALFPILDPGISLACTLIRY